MTAIDEILDGVAPSSGWVADWNDVLRRAGEPRRTRRMLSSRRLVVALAVAAVAIAPLVALAASNDWWFLGHGAPTPTTNPVVVRTGSWEGFDWQLVAYPSTTDGLCFAVTPQDTATSDGAGFVCAPFVGVPRTATTKHSSDMSITFLLHRGGEPPSYIAGPVIDAATAVQIHLSTGETLTTPTFPAPEPLQHVRFYALSGQLPASKLGRSLPITWIAGIDADGNVVACLKPATAHDGVSALSDCR
jgi:hypothetical protein